MCRACILTAVATYNDAVIAEVQAGNPREIAPGQAVYAASKTEAERQAFKWVEENQPRFRFNTVVPDNVVWKFPFLETCISANVSDWLPHQP